MINPIELRLGNFFHPTIKTRQGIRIPVGAVSKVLTLSTFELSWLEMNKIPAQHEKWPTAAYSEIEPIPITEEWLIKFGFKFRIGTSRWTIGKIDGPDYEYDVSLYGDKFIYRKIQVRHVHQLQNLYFALTGKELTI